VRICAYCATANADALRFCTRCAAVLDRAPYRPRSSPPVESLAPALSSARPVARSARPSSSGATVLVPALPIGPLFVLSAAPAASDVPRQGQSTRRPVAARERFALAQTLGWVGGGVLLCGALLLTSQQAMRHLPAWPPALALPEEDAPGPDSVDAQPEPALPVAPDAAPRPALDARTLAAAINSELRRLGVGSVEVSMADGGATTVTGRLPSREDRDELLLWLQSVPGVGDIVDGIRVDPAPTVAPPPPPPRPVRPPARVPQAPPAAPALVERSPAAQPALVTPANPARPEPMAAPDADAIARALRGELARLALPDVTVDVDPSTLLITLRGRTSDAARKAQALAAARAANPGGRVRDLVFVIDE
jgi:hypothetical protein